MSHLNTHSIDNNHSFMDSLERSSTPNQRLFSPRYERNVDSGDVEYRYEIDVSDYKPNEIQVKQNGYSLTIDASCYKKSQNKDPNSNCSRSEKKEYHKTISLPQNTDLSKEVIQNFANGRLIVKVPVLPHGNNFVSSLSRSNFGTLSSSGGSSTTGDSSPGFVTSPHLNPNPNPVHQFHTEILQIDPCFSKSDIKIERLTAPGNVIQVRAHSRHNDEHGCTSERQYHSEHKFPINSDLDQLQAEWIKGELRISAPYKH